MKRPATDSPEEYGEDRHPVDPSKPQPLKTRPVTSCSMCRQQKVKCDAGKMYPNACTRCAKLNKHCVVDPLYKPPKGSQLKSLMDDVHQLRQEIELLRQPQNQSHVTQPVPHVTQVPGHVLHVQSVPNHVPPSHDMIPHSQNPSQNPHHSPQNTHNPSHSPHNTHNPSPHNPSPHNPSPHNPSPHNPFPTLPPLPTHLPPITVHRTHTSKPVTTTTSASPSSTYTLNGVTLNNERVVRLHKRFVERYLPYLPILETHSPEELYEQSKLLFWTVMVTACQSDPNPQQYNQLWPHVKNLIIETCWLHTPRSTHVVQALLVLATWPLPNMKILDDWSYRLIGLAKNISLQLGLHRGEFVSEFSRSQVRMTDAVKWRTRSWMAIFFLEQVWCSSLGLPPTTQADSLINNAATKLPSFSFSILVRLSAFCSRLINLVGNSQTSADGLIPYDDRINVLAVINNELDIVAQQLDLSEPSAEMYYLNIRLMIAVFSFIGGTDTRFIMSAYNAATRAVAILCGLPYQITQYPIWMRQCASFAATVLFRLHLSPHLLPKYHETARGSVVALHAKFKQMVTHWPVDNDISRIAKVVEKLNRTIVTNPELFKTPGIVSRMRSHLSASLFYELIWIIHEAQRRNGGGNSQGVSNSGTGRNTPTQQTSVASLANGNGSSSNGTAVPATPATNGSAAPVNGIIKGPDDPDPSMAPLQLERPAVVKDEQFNDFGFPPDLGVMDIMQDWMDGKGDDFLGWMDVNLSPEF
ncbi:putative transcription factor SEF1 [Yarrowia sp. C11]|nr:putative transcription factor SEF1 [Yarrowia sp. E02]KAG5369484.1 putative transcription factor SEF1 [Yarrowia sp. C11]